MKFIKGFYVYSNGHIEHAWLNMSLIKSYMVTDLYFNKEGVTKYNFLKCDMGSESADKIPYIDGNQPMEIKSAEEVFQLAVIKKEDPPKRGRPRKEQYIAHHPV